MLSVGLTGNIACGKSAVAAALAAHGCRLIDADEVVADLYARGAAGWQAVVEGFGPGILTPAGEIDRAALARLAFASEIGTARINALIHPLVRRKLEEMLETLAAASPGGIVVIEATLMVESGSYRNYDVLVVVTCEPGEQERRALARGMAPADFMARRERQMPQDEKAALADFVIDNSGPFEETAAQVTRLYAALRERAAGAVS